MNVEESALQVADFLSIEDNIREFCLDCLALMKRRNAGLEVLAGNVILIEFDMDHQEVTLRDDPEVYPEGRGSVPLQFSVTEFRAVASRLAEPWRDKEVQALIDSYESQPAVALPPAPSSSGRKRDAVADSGG